MHSDTIRGLVFNVQGFTVHDGPGIRTEFFMKGCPLSCEWCSNPEGMRTYPEPGIYPDKCLSLDDCTRCVRACRTNSILISGRPGGGHQPGHLCPLHGLRPCVSLLRYPALGRILHRGKGYGDHTPG